MNKKTEERICYYVCESIRHDNGDLMPVIVKDGEKGYYTTDYHWGTDIEIAEKAAARKNKLLGLTEEDVDGIVFRSMF